MAELSEAEDQSHQRKCKVPSRRCTEDRSAEVPAPMSLPVPHLWGAGRVAIRDHRPLTKTKSSGKIARYILQQLEDAMLALLRQTLRRRVPCA